MLLGQSLFQVVRSPLLSNLAFRGDKQLREKREKAKEILQKMRNGEEKLNDVLRKSIHNLVKVLLLALLI